MSNKVPMMQLTRINHHIFYYWKKEESIWFWIRNRFQFISKLGCSCSDESTCVMMPAMCYIWIIARTISGSHLCLFIFHTLRTSFVRVLLILSNLLQRTSHFVSVAQQQLHYKNNWELCKWDVHCDGSLNTKFQKSRLALVKQVSRASRHTVIYGNSGVA